MRLMAVKSRKGLYSMIFNRRSRGFVKDGGTVVGIGDPSLFHALVIIFLEFFAWGLLTVPIINVLAATFPTNKFLMNGLILGIKGLLSFLSAPLLGALSDIWGRKFFLLLTVFCTCMPIPLLTFSPWWYFALFSISGVFSVTFSVVLAYVADITEKDERNAAYGLVSAMFGASLVISPALGAYASEIWSDQAVVAIATAVAALDVLFIMVAVPESLKGHSQARWDQLNWDAADPFATLKMVGENSLVMSLCLIVFLSYLPEAGQFSCFFVYLKLIVGFSPEAVAAFIGITGVLAVFAQTAILMVLQRAFDSKHTIMIGLIFQFIQLLWYGFCTKSWMMWAAGVLAAFSQITYPSISGYVSIHTDKDKQGTVQGMVTGIRGLCTGLGPACFGFIFYLFNVDLNIEDDSIRAPFPRKGIASSMAHNRLPVVPKLPVHPVIAPFVVHSINGSDITNSVVHIDINQRAIPGPPFVFGAILVAMAIMAVAWLPDFSAPKHHKLPSSSFGNVTTDGAASGAFEPHPSAAEDPLALKNRLNSSPSVSHAMTLDSFQSSDYDSDDMSFSVNGNASQTLLRLKNELDISNQPLSLSDRRTSNNFV